MRATLESDCLTEVTTEVRARGDMDTGEAGDGTRDAPTAMAVTPTAADTASTATLEPMERNENGKRRRRSENGKRRRRSEAVASAVGPGDWRSRMERTAQQQARELAQLHRTIAKMANMLETQTAMQKAQW